MTFYIIRRVNPGVVVKYDGVLSFDKLENGTIIMLIETGSTEGRDEIYIRDAISVESN